MPEPTVTERPKMSHTPGPWEVCNSNGQTLVLGEPEPGGGGTRVVAACGAYQSEESRANARLTAASPELLAELKEAVRLIRQWHGMGLGPAEEPIWEIYQASPEMTRINAAIAKAEGRS